MLEHHGASPDPPPPAGFNCSRAAQSPRTHFKGLEPVLLLDVFYALIALLLEVLFLPLIQQANFIQECCVAPNNLKTKETCINGRKREKDGGLGSPWLHEVALCNCQSCAEIGQERQVCT